MQPHLRGAARAGAPRAPRNALAWSAVAVAVIVVVAAGVSGATRFTGPRWLVRIHTPPVKPRHVRGGVPKAHLTGGGSLPGWPLWVVAGLLVLAAAWLVYRWWPGLPSRRSIELGPAGAAPSAAVTVSPMPEPEPEPDAPAVRTGIEYALQALGEDGEPADAVIRAWLGLQETAEESGIRRGPAETPTEFTTRVVRRALGDDQAVRTLLRLYQRTRFGDHPVTAGDVASVQEALDELVRTWPLPGTRA